MGIASIDKLGCGWPRRREMYTSYPQIALTACITCAQENFFARKVCTFLSLCQVEKKSAGIVLIRRSIPKQ
jgi:hypothetical protein